jgi:hypothetical protein
LALVNGSASQGKHPGQLSLCQSRDYAAAPDELAAARGKSNIGLGDSGRTQVRGQSCKLTGFTSMSEGWSFLPDVADPWA